uniref:Uncharacterized protein n=1 Tax=Timema douglasi TaxID=61478 RepID=A0A7R8VSA2_TIMDO|nr:unnamed protein product [Timema douglasi]
MFLHVVSGVPRVSRYGVASRDLEAGKVVLAINNICFFMFMLYGVASRDLEAGKVVLAINNICFFMFMLYGVASRDLEAGKVVLAINNICFFMFMLYGVASRDLEAGKVVFTESPVAVGPKVDSPPLCLGCYAFVDGSSLCTLCGWPVCGPQCQDSPQHATNECPIFKEAGVNFQSVEDFNIPSPQYECIAPLRALLSRESNPDRWDAEVTAMEAHNSKRRETDVWGVNQVNTVDFLRKQCKLADRNSRASRECPSTTCPNTAHEHLANSLQRFVKVQLTSISRIPFNDLSKYSSQASQRTPFNDLSKYSSRASHEFPSTICPNTAHEHLTNSLQ